MYDISKNNKPAGKILFLIPQAPPSTIYPWYLREERHSGDDTGYSLAPAMAASILGCLQERVPSAEIDFLDLQLTPMKEDALKEFVRNVSPDIILTIVSANLLDIPTEKMVLELGVKTLCILSPVQTNPEEAVEQYNLKCEYFTYTDEVELTVANAVEELFDTGDIKFTDGLFSNNTISNHFTPPVNPSDITRLPMPAYDLIKLENYVHKQQQMGKPKAVLINTMKGCPFTCSFCCVGSSKYPARIKTAKQMYDEIRLLHKRYGVEWFYFLNSEFSPNKKVAKEFCRMVINSDLKIKYNIKERIECVDNELLSLLRESGCMAIYYGVETADSRIQKEINKNVNLSRCIDVIEKTKEAGISAIIYMMLGLPGEDAHTLQKNVDFVVKARPDGVAWSILFPEHGSLLFENLKSSGRLLSDSWSDYRNLTTLCFNHNYYKNIEDIKKAKHTVQMQYRLSLFKQRDYEINKRLISLCAFLITFVYSAIFYPIINRSNSLSRFKEQMKIMVSRKIGPIL